MMPRPMAPVCAVAGMAARRRGRVQAIRLLARLCLSLGLSLMAGHGIAQAQFRGDASHRGWLPGAPPASAPSVAWHFATGARIVSSPVVADGTVYVGSDDGHVYALDAASGQLRWAWRTEGPVPSTPAVSDGRVHVLSYDGRLHTLDAASGAPLWMFRTEGERRFEARGLHGSLPRTQTVADPYDVFLSSPAVAGGVVYLGSSDGHLYAMDAASGALRWKQRTAEVVHASPAVADGVVVVGSWDGVLHAFDARTGDRRWALATGRDALMHNQQGFQSSPAIVDGVVYVGCRDAHLYAVDLRTGVERWRVSTGSSWVVSSPAVVDGQVIFATSDTSLVQAVDAATGAPRWTRQAKAYVFASPTVAGGLVLVGQLNGELLALRAVDGSAEWRWRTEASLANRGWVLTADGKLNAPWLFGSNWHEAMALGFDRQSSVGSLFSSVWLHDGTLYLGSAEGRLYALRAQGPAAAQP
jgi:eukaryotic-like serine/threonine-protein kinase